MTVKLTQINLTRMIDAQPHEIYDVWLDKTSPGSPWFGVPKVILDKAEVDGLFYTMYQIENNEVAHYGRFTALERPRKIQYTWVSQATHGMESVLTITFTPKEGKTEVHIVHSNVPDDEEGNHHLNAWSYVISRMITYFAELKK